MTDRYRALAVQLLDRADIRLDGARPWDIRVNDPRFFRRAMVGGAIGLGESYMDGWWDCAALDEAFVRILQADLRAHVRLDAAMIADALVARAPDIAYFAPGWRPFLARFRASMATAETHYDVGNDFYRAVLDERMVYSCGYWRTARTLAEAQLAKLELSCRKLDLKPGMKVLDIGCGWGAFARYAAETHGVEVTGVTISEEQRRYAQDNCAGLPVDIRLMDYRSVTGRFDRVASFGMFEHVGRRNFRAFLEVAHGALAPDGLLLLETIGDDVSGGQCNPWFQKYIFTAPTSMFPSVKELGSAAEGLFTMEDWQNIGADYAPTLRAWHDNLAAHRDAIVARHGERIYRMWAFYLLSCAGAFAARTYQMWQIVYARRGVGGGFVAR
jgi:cyclopropane-fatty-acyl-phospholipid synthase